MNVTIEEVDGVTTVQLVGVLDTNTSREVQTAILPRVKDAGRVLLDVTGVDYMSSAGLRFLLSLYRQTANAEGKLVLVGLSEEIRDTMAVTGFLDFFDVCPTRQDGLARLSTG